jgi:hypothetical protein
LTLLFLVCDKGVIKAEGYGRANTLDSQEAERDKRKEEARDKICLLTACLQ